MKPVLRMFLFALALVGWATAELPKKAPITKYIGLWSNSPFTSKPPPPEAGPVVNPLEDYALAGVSPISAGYRVTLLNKKKPDERIIVDTDSLKSDYKILEVIRKPGDPLATVVRMQAGAVIGSVAFDEKLLVLATPKTPPKAPPGAPGAPAAAQGASSRLPRPRVVPPAPPAPATAPGASTGQRPTHRGSYSR